MLYTALKAFCYALAFETSVVVASSLVSVRVPIATPEQASAPISSDFLGLSFELSSFTRYAKDDNGSINVFSTNLMDAIYSRTRGRPIIRLGGTSSDYGKYSPDQTEPALPVAERDHYQDIGHTVIGPSYWNLTKNFPSAKYIIQVPLATTNISETVSWTKSAVDIIGLDKIFSIQPGNEADLYTDTFTGADGIPLHPPEYQGNLTNETYVGNWTRYVSAIKEGVFRQPSGRYFTAFDTAAYFGADVAANQYKFAVDQCFSLGIDDGETVKEVAAHYYQGNAGTNATLGSTLMNMTMTHNHLDQFKVRINWLRDNKPEVPFVLSEVGNSLHPKNEYPYQARLGSALWQVDFYLYSMAIGVARINYHQIMHAGSNMWLPVASAEEPAQVFSNFYSQVLLADFIVCSLSISKGSLGKTRVSQLEINASNTAAYVAYEDDVPRRIAVVNLDHWSVDMRVRRGTVSFKFEIPAVGRVSSAYLNAPGGAHSDARSITYDDSQWTYHSLGKEIRDYRHGFKTAKVEDGAVVVTVSSSEAVLIWLD
ncbi:hypothetical protein F4808DRAFT_462708 [Astrocystis sublimbata]|nr:hypothetical protein F4808DRAFT_462708 [Astrocystis sublimbata]